MDNKKELNNGDFEPNMIEGSHKVYSAAQEKINDEINHNAYLAIEGAKETRKRLIANSLRKKGIDPSKIFLDDSSYRLFIVEG